MEKEEVTRERYIELINEEMRKHPDYEEGLAVVESPGHIPVDVSKQYVSWARTVLRYAPPDKADLVVSSRDQ